MRHSFLHLTKRHIVVLCIASAISRLVFLAVAHPPISVAEDYAIAQHLARGDGFSIYERGPTSIKGPFYPTYLAAWIWLLGERNGLQAAIVFQHLLYATMPWLLVVLGKAIARPTLGIGAAVLFALHPTYFYHATVAENTTWVVVLSAVWGIFVFGKHRHPFAAALAAGAILGSFVLEKPPLVPPMLALLGVRWRRQWRLLATAALGSILIVLPWAARGALLFGEPTLTKSYAGYLTFIHSWLPNMAIHPRYAVTDSVQHLVDSLGTLPEREALPALRTIAHAILREKLHLLPERTVLHALIFWAIPPRYWHQWTIPFILVRVVPVIILTVLLGWGTALLWQHDRGLVLGVLGILAWTTLFYSFYHVLNIRFKLEVEWLQLFVCAAPFVPKHRRGVYSPHQVSLSSEPPMRKLAAWGLLMITALVVVTNGGCSSSSSSTGGNSMSAIVGSENWNASTVEATNSNNVIVIGGLNSSGTIQIRLQTYGITQAGTVQIAASQPHTATLYEYGSLYSANAIVGSGTITFSKLTSQEAEGTFSFIAVNTDKQQSRSVTNGKFSVRFK